jgi:hypothetical protein
MDEVALEVLKKAEAWEWPTTSRIQESGKTSFQGHNAQTFVRLHHPIATARRYSTGSILGYGRKMSSQLKDNGASRSRRVVFTLTFSQ